MHTLWPNEQSNLTAHQSSQLHEQLIGPFQNRLQQLAIDQSLSGYLVSFYIPFANWLSRQKTLMNGTLVVGINGAQGSGKSTLSQLTADVLQLGFKLNTVTLSIDDLYKTRQQRRRMADDIHPLFKTRGVPGTHDTQLGIDIIEKVKRLKKGESIALPAFDKGNDEPLPTEQWPLCYGPVDILIFEGWCVGAGAQTEEALQTHTNQLEAREDAQGVWRRTVNEHLKTDYGDLFSLLDCLVFLKTPSFDCVLKWRSLQEKKLTDQHQQEKHLMTTKGVMQRFIDHYERLTLFQLEDLPNKAKLTIKLGTDHQIKQLQFANPANHESS